MSRGYNARRKARRRQADTSGTAAAGHRTGHARRRLVSLLPLLAIAGVLGGIAVVGLSTGGERVEQEVAKLLADIPQNSNFLGSPRAPITLEMYADLECPTVKRFTEKYLPSIIERWVRTGVVRLSYRSLKTDTADEHIFFRQEAAALAAGRQGKMWNYALTFIKEQKQDTNYGTPEFLTSIAAQVPGLKQKRWQIQREETSLLSRVILNLQVANSRNMSYTPSFSLEFNDRARNVAPLSEVERQAFMTSLLRNIDSLRAESDRDNPAVEAFGSRLPSG